MKITTSNIIIGIIIVIFLWISSGFFVHYVIGSSDRGTFGDMFGAINALFSGLALFGIIVSIMIQQRELKLQQEELVETRVEFKINRLTNVLFKQVEYLNTVIENASFPNGNIMKFVNTMNVYDKAEEFDYIVEYVELNRIEIIALTTRVISFMENFEDLLQHSKIDSKEVVQMKKIFRKSINPFYIELLNFYLNTLKKPEPESIVDELEREILIIELERIQYIINYGSNK